MRLPWITNGFTLVRYGESLIAETGGLNVKELIVGDFQEDEFIIEAGVGNLIAPGQAFALANQGQNLLSGSINVLGGSGLNELQLSNLNRRIEQTERLSRNNLLTR